MTKLHQEDVWKVIRKTRLSLLSEYTDIDCYSEDIILLQDIIRNNTNSIAAELKISTLPIPNKKVSHKTLQTAGEMFTFLNHCPPKLFLDIFKNGTARDIILALTSVIKTLKNANEKKVTIEVFTNLMDSINLKDFENVQISTKGSCFTNAIFGNCTKDMHLNNKEIQGFFKVYNIKSINLIFRF